MTGKSTNNLNSLLILTLLSLASFSLAFAQPIPLSMDFERDALSLHGSWQSLLNHESEDLFLPQVADPLTKWKDVEIPKGQIPGDTWQVKTRPQCVWLRRSFNVTDSQASRDAVLKFNGIRFGAAVWINEKLIDSYPNIGPHTVLLPPGTLKPGQNYITLKITGWAGLEKSKADFPLVPTGSGPEGWGAKTTAVYDDIWLEFYDTAYAKYILAIPDPLAKTVTFRISLDSINTLPEALSSTIKVLLDDNPVGSGNTKIHTSKSPIDITVPVSDVKTWTPQTPTLYRADITLVHKGRTCDHVSFNFGMRKTAVVEGHYNLNGKRLRFHGSNLVNEWNWGGYESEFNRQTKRYIIDEAKNMNLNSFRTHTLPPPTSWLDIADENGAMFLAEFPILYNYKDPQFTPDQWDIFHKNALDDVTAWVTKLWNHPSIMIWVLTNESNDDHWEMNELRDYVLALDPTRPTLRSGEETAETVDLHPTSNFFVGPEGRFILSMTKAAAHKDPARTLGNTEYMNVFGPDEKITTRWLGRPSEAGFHKIFAEFAAEHTEVMRRTDFDIILPYMYAGWPRFRGNNWRDDFPTPVAAALYSTMAPVFASLDLFDRNFLAGAKIAIPLHLINDTHDEVRVKLDLYITPKDPLFVPDDDALAAAVYHDADSEILKADSHTVERITIPVPAEPGVYYLAAVLRRDGHRPVVSQRTVRSFDIKKPKSLKSRRITVLGADHIAEKWLMENRISFTTTLPKGKIKTDILVIWDATKIGHIDRNRAADILDYIEQGGRLVVLDHPKWDWNELLNLQTGIWKSIPDVPRGAAGASRLFPFPKATEHFLLAGIDPEYLKRFNGLPGAIADYPIYGSALKTAQRLLWGDNPKFTFAASLKKGRGEIILCQLHLKRRLDRSSKRYDPVAEQILLNLIGR